MNSNAAPEDANRPGERARNVVVVSGRDDGVREAIFAFLRKLGLRPLEWESVIQGMGARAPIRDVIAHASALAQAALVLLTPDELVALQPALRDEGDPDGETRPALQRRPNILIELGIVLTAYDERVVIVEFGGLRPITDLARRNVIHFGSPTVALEELALRLKVAGCAVDDTGSEWRDTERFTQLAAHQRGT